MVRPSASTAWAREDRNDGPRGVLAGSSARDLPVSRPRKQTGGRGCKGTAGQKPVLTLTPHEPKRVHDETRACSAS
jgi:hypothetical protein